MRPRMHCLYVDASVFKHKQFFYQNFNRILRDTKFSFAFLVCRISPRPLKFHRDADVIRMWEELIRTLISTCILYDLKLKQDD